MAAAVLFAVLIVGYYIADPGDFGLVWSNLAYYALMFPVFLLAAALAAAILSGVADWSRARLAGAGFVLDPLGQERLTHGTPSKPRDVTRSLPKPLRRGAAPV